jgi:hypothetical protein
MLNRRAAVLLMLLLITPLVFGRPMDLPVTILDLRAHGIRLLSPLDPAFDGIAGPLIGPRSNRLLGLKPLVVVVTNDTRKTVAAVSVIFRVAKPSGGIVAWTNVAFPDVVVGDIGSEKRQGLRPHESTVVSQGVVVEDFDGPGPEDWYRDLIDGVLRQRDEYLQDARHVTIELDAVIFDDGTLVGPDEDGKLTSLFLRRVGAYQQWLQTIAAGLAAGQSVEAAYAPILQFQEEVRARQGSLQGLSADSRDVQVWRTNAAADLVKWRRRIGDAELPRTLAGLKLSRFDIHR